MATDTGLVRAACNTSTGNQDFRDPNMTTTPTAARFIIVGATADGTAADHIAIGIGATDGTNQWAAAAQDQSGVGTTNTRNHGMTDACIAILNQSDPATIDGEASFVSFLADVGAGAGVRINWTNAPGSAYLMVVQLFTADNAAAGTYDPSDTTNGTVAVTVGFQSTLILLSHHYNTFDDGGDVNAYFGDGACDASLNQGSQVWRSSDAVSGTQSRIKARNDGAATSGEITNNWYHEITAIGATDFTVTTRQTGDAGVIIGYLALDTGAVGTWAGGITIPNTTGNNSYTGPGFVPEFVHIGSSLAEAYDVLYQDDRADSFSLSCFTAGNQYTQTVNTDDGAATTDTQSLSDDQAVVICDDTGAVDIAATFVSFDATGWTLNFSNVSTNAKVGFAWAIERQNVTFVMDAVLKAQNQTATFVMDTVIDIPTPATPTVVPPVAGIVAEAANYEVVLMDSRGVTFDIIDDWQALTYTRAINAIGALSLTIDGNYSLFEFLKPDGRLAIWRKVGGRSYIDTETTWLIRKISRMLDKGGTRTIEIEAVSANELLARRIIPYDSSASEASASAENADDLMKRIIRYNYSASATDGDAGRDISSYLDIEADTAQGPAITKEFGYDNVMAVLQEISQTSITSTSPVYFDIVAPAQNTLEFRTYRGLRGVDHSFPDGLNPVIISAERGNLVNVTRTYDWSKEATFVYATGQGTGLAQQIQSASSAERINISVFNRRELLVNANAATASDALVDEAQAALRENRPRRVFTGQLVNVPGATEYGIHWNFGDRITADFEGESISCIIEAITIDVAGGEEQIKGKLRADED